MYTSYLVQLHQSFPAKTTPPPQRTVPSLTELHAKLVQSRNKLFLIVFNLPHSHIKGWQPIQVAYNATRSAHSLQCYTQCPPQLLEGQMIPCQFVYPTHRQPCVPSIFPTNVISWNTTALPHLIVLIIHPGFICLICTLILNIMLTHTNYHHTVVGCTSSTTISTFTAPLTLLLCPVNDIPVIKFCQWTDKYVIITNLCTDMVHLLMTFII